MRPAKKSQSQTCLPNLPHPITPQQMKSPLTSPTPPSGHHIHSILPSMALVITHDCRPWENETRSDLRNVTAAESATGTMPEFYNGFLLTLVLFALAGNTISLFVLTRARLKRDFGHVRIFLVCLTVADLGFNIFAACTTINDLLFILPAYQRACQAGCLLWRAVLMWQVDSLISTRNWCVVLIALSRCDAILRPMNRLKRKISWRKLTVFVVIIFIISMSMAMARLFGEKAVICASANTTLKFKIIAFQKEKPLFHVFNEVICFIFQRAAPIVIIFFTTVAMLANVLRRRSSQMEAAQHLNSTHQNSAIRATRTVITLTTVFILLEGLTFVYSLVKETMEQIGNPVDNETDMVMEMVNRICTIIDSCCNAFIYVMSGRLVKREFRLYMRRFSENDVRVTRIQLTPSTLVE